MAIISQPHEWGDFTPARMRVCSRCKAEDVWTGPRGSVQWPCILPLDTWSLDDLKEALRLSLVEERFVEMVQTRQSHGRRYTGILVPRASSSRRGSSRSMTALYPDNLPPSVTAGRSIVQLFRWMQSVKFRPESDPEFTVLISTKSED